MLFRCFIISASLELCKVVSNQLFYQVWIIRVIRIQCCDIHRKLCVRMNRSRDLHHTQVLAIFLRAGTLQMVSEHSVACRIETLGLVRNKFG